MMVSRSGNHANSNQCFALRIALYWNEIHVRFTEIHQIKVREIKFPIGCPY